MIVLDTNVVSELMKSGVEAVVIEWLNQQPRLSIWISTITVFEIRLGIGLLPASRRVQLELGFMRMLSEKIENRTLPFDTAAAEQAAALSGARQQSGRLGELRDTMIAGIVISPRATLATRNIRHFADLPTPVVNPWAD
jgi:predicted nucleic acid-binding protein